MDCCLWCSYWGMQAFFFSFGSSIYYVLPQRELGMEATVRFSTLAASPNGDGDKVGVQGNLVSPHRLGIPEAEVILWLLVNSPSVPTAEPLAFLAFSLEKIVYCFLGTLVSVGVVCLCIGHNVSPPKEKWTYLFNYNTLYFSVCVVSLIEKSYLETDLSF